MNDVNKSKNYKCGTNETCGGFQLAHLSYDEQLKYKKRM